METKPTSEVYSAHTGPVILTKIGVRVKCLVCDREKAPRGRSISAAIYNSYCTRDGCIAYDAEPHVGDLFPGETAEDFGYPCSDVGTIPVFQYKNREQGGGQ